MAPGPGHGLRGQLWDDREHDPSVARGEHGPAVDGPQGGSRVGGLLLGCHRLGRAGPRGPDDPGPADEHPELIAREPTGPGEEDQPIEHGLDVAEGFTGEEVPDGLAIALLVVHDREQRRASSTARVEQVVERRERGRLGRGLVRSTVGHGGRIPTQSSPGSRQSDSLALVLVAT